MCHLPISVADLGCSVYHVKLLIPLRLQNLCSLNFTSEGRLVGTAARQPLPLGCVNVVNASSASKRRTRCSGVLKFCIIEESFIKVGCFCNDTYVRSLTSLLNLRRLMSYIYIYIYIYIYMELPFLMFLDHTQRRSTVGRTPLDE